jgi:hypothetical protein
MKTRLLIDFIDLRQHGTADTFEFHATILKPNLSEREKTTMVSKRPDLSLLLSLVVPID